MSEKSDKKNEGIHPVGLIRTIEKRSQLHPNPNGEEGYEEISSLCLEYRPSGKRPSGDGYGKIMFEGKRLLVHQVIWEYHNQMAVPEGYQVCHHCDNPPCSRPDHLYAGTPSDNVQDAIRRNRRSAKGKNNGAHIHPEKRPHGEKRVLKDLNEGTIACIKGSIHEMGKSKQAVFSIAVHFDTSPEVVREIADGKEGSEVIPVVPDALPELLDPSRYKDELASPSNRSKRLTRREVAEIRVRYFEASEKEKRKGLKKKLAVKYGVSVTTIRDVLERRNHKDVAPEIPAIAERGHGMAKATDREVQEMRATWGKYCAGNVNHQKGLLAAMGRYFGLSQGNVRKIIDRDLRCDVSDDPNAVLALEDLKPRTLNPTGEDHGNSKVTEEMVLEMHRLKHEEGFSGRAISRHFGALVTPENVNSILRGNTWAHIYEQYHGHPPKRK